MCVCCVCVCVYVCVCACKQELKTLKTMECLMRRHSSDAEYQCSSLEIQGMMFVACMSFVCETQDKPSLPRMP